MSEKQSGIVERLRGCETETSLELMKQWCEEAADELVRQSAVLLAQETEIERLRAALTKMTPSLSVNSGEAHSLVVDQDGEPHFAHDLEEIARLRKALDEILAWPCKSDDLLDARHALYTVRRLAREALAGKIKP